MSEPLNPLGLQRIRALIDLIERHNGPEADMRIWISDDYVSLEVKSMNLPINDVRLIMGAAPLEADEVADKVERRRIARENALKRRGDYD